MLDRVGGGEVDLPVTVLAEPPGALGFRRIAAVAGPAAAVRHFLDLLETSPHLGLRLPAGAEWTTGGEEAVKG